MNTPASTSRNVKTGAFIILGVALLLGFIFWIGQRQNLFRDTFRVHADFKNIAGLKNGNFVRFGGINIGTVSNIAIVNDTTVRVDMLIKQNIRPFIKTDVIANIGTEGLMGDKLVQLGPGSPGAPPLQEDGNLHTMEPADMDRIITRLNEIADNAASLTGGLSNLVAKINSGQGSLGRLVNSDKLAKQLESTVSSTKNTVNNINQTATSVKENMEAAKHSIFLRGYFKKKEKKRIEDSISNAKKAADSLKKAEKQRN